jgi:hypothetical protein
LSAAFQRVMLLSPHICDGAARGGWLAKLQWLVLGQKCPVYSDISVSTAASGSIPVLTLLRELNISFIVGTACSAAAAGHQHAIEYLHAEGCLFNNSVYLAAAMSGHVHILQRLRELQWPCDSAALRKLAAERGHLHVLQWAKQHGAVFTGVTMLQAAAHGQTAVCEYLLAQQCPCSADACTAAAGECQLGTLQLLLQHGCPYNVNSMWVAAAKGGHITALSYLQQHGILVDAQELMLLLFVAGALGHLALAQWLRAHGAAWRDVLSVVSKGIKYQWEGAVLEWARAEGCTSPLQ